MVKGSRAKIRRVGVKPGLWTLDWTHGLDCGLRFGLDFGLMRCAMTTISNNKLSCADRMCYKCTKALLVFIKHVEVELIIFLGKLVKGASPQGIGHQVETRMQ